MLQNLNFDIVLFKSNDSFVKIFILYLRTEWNRKTYMFLIYKTKTVDSKDKVLNRNLKSNILSHWLNGATKIFTISLTPIMLKIAKHKICKNKKVLKCFEIEVLPGN